jgi:hypothetical protein
MPTYHIHGTTVKLYVWDPHQSPSKVEVSQIASTPLDAAYGRDVEPLKEEYFQGHEGVEFLGSDMPFFLVQAGKDLFFNRRQNSGVAELSSPPDEQSRELQASSNEVDDDDSTLSSMSSSMFADLFPPETEQNSSPNIGLDESNLRTATSQLTYTVSTKNNKKKKYRGWVNLKPKMESQDIVSKPITTATPMKCNIELSKTSFLKSLCTSDQQDLCVNIFYNGQLAHSRVLRQNTACSFTAEEKEQPFAGRRIDTNLEVPWVILPMTEYDTIVASSAQVSSSFEERWNNVNELLLQEAGHWGHAGKFEMFRAPVGEYLEELSKRPMPESMKGKDTVACKAGIIDVSNKRSVPKFSALTQLMAGRYCCRKINHSYSVEQSYQTAAKAPRRYLWQRSKEICRP